MGIITIITVLYSIFLQCTDMSLEECTTLSQDCNCIRLQQIQCNLIFCQAPIFWSIEMDRESWNFSGDLVSNYLTHFCLGFNVDLITCWWFYWECLVTLLRAIQLCQYFGDDWGDDIEVSKWWLTSLPGADWLIDSCLVSPSPPIAQLPPGKQPKTTLLTLYKQNGQFFNPIWNEGLPLDSINFAVTRSNLHSTFCFHPFLPKKQFLWNNCYPKDLANWIRCWPNQVCLITINNSFHEKICCINNKILKGRNKLTSSPTVPTVTLWICLIFLFSIFLYIFLIFFYFLFLLVFLNIESEKQIDVLSNSSHGGTLHWHYYFFFFCLDNLFVLIFF